MLKSLVSRPRVAAGAALALLMTMMGTTAQAQSLQCTEGVVREGDARLWLLRSCGQPAIADAYCARGFTPPQQTPQPVLVVPHAYGVVQPVQPVPQVTCIPTDEWLYERGDGNLPAFVRIREGKVISIRYGEQGRSLPR